MKSFHYLRLMFVAVTFMFTQLHAQTVFNKEWVETTGQPDSIHWTASTIDPFKNVVITGNTVTSIGNPDILTTKYDAKGMILWQQQFGDSDSLRDYGVAIASQSNGDIYIAGVVSDANSFFNIAIIKYSKAGVLLWSKTWDGADHLHDVPSAIAVNSSGDVFITGTTQSVAKLTDYVTLKYDQSGNFKWASFYDYTSLSEYATSISLLATGNVVITGASASSGNSWDYATVEYASLNGTQQYVKRVTANGVGLDNALAIARDNSGNIYITGYAEDNGNKNIQTVKLNSSFGLVWVKNYDGSGLEDIANSIGIDSQGDIYILGHTKKSNGGTDFVLIKYDPFGNEKWVSKYKAPNEFQTAEGHKLAIDSRDNIYCVGTIDNGGTKDYSIVKFDTKGKIRWETHYNGTGNGDDEPLDVEIDGSGSVYVTGLSKDGTGSPVYATIKYSPYTMPYTASSNTVGPLHLEQQILIQFNPDLVNLSFVDNKDLTFASLADVIPDSVIDSMSVKIGFDLKGKYDIKLVKIFRWMTSADAISITRLGDSIPIPKFWSAFILTLPDFVDLQNAADNLRTLFPMVEASHLNLLGEADGVPNDTYAATEQESLIPTSTYPNGSINMDPAWDIETGKNNVKVGVYDWPIYWAHEDFGDGTYAGSKIAGGWDFNTGVHISNVTNTYDSHGTSCAGIIGALRNNGKGIAGIAGGDVAQGNTGVQLYSMGIFDDNIGGGVGKGLTPTSTIISAIVNGASSTGYGLNIQNHSWGVDENGSTIFHNDIYLLAQAIKFSWQNQCVIVASRGNDGNTSNNFPATFRDHQVINVGASGTNGDYMSTSNGDVINSSYGQGVDIIAPGTTHIVSAPYNPAYPWSWTNDLNDPLYSTFRGTSAAAPHVAGLAALMMSKHNTANLYPNDLSPDDIEVLLQHYATDQTTYGVGYDDHTGYGLVNAGATMQVLKSPNYWVKHRPGTVGTTGHVNNGSSISVYLPENLGNIVAGNYWADRYMYFGNYDDNISSTTTILDIWPRYSSVTGVSNNPIITGEPDMTLSYTISNNQVHVSTATYCWHVIANIGWQAMDVWIPTIPDNLKTAYSLHLYDPNGTIGIDELSDEKADIVVFPNPISDVINIHYSFQHHQGKTKLEIYDVLGKVVYSEDLGELSSRLLSVNSANLGNGLYICKLITNSNQYISKIIKQ